MIIRMISKDIRMVGRNTLGVKLINLAEDDVITDIALIPKGNNEKV